MNTQILLIFYLRTKYHNLKKPKKKQVGTFKLQLAQISTTNRIKTILLNNIISMQFFGIYNLISNFANKQIILNI